MTQQADAAPRSAVILVRINNNKTMQTEGQRCIRIPLTEVGPQTVDEWVASALQNAPSPIHTDDWGKY